MLDEFDWHRLAHGDFERPVRVGTLTPDLCRHMRCDDRRVMLDPAYVPKLRFKHNLEAEHLGMMPLCLDFGTAVQDRRDTLSFFYDDQAVFGRIFHLVVKTTGRRHELWVTTFFAVDNSEYNRRLKRAVLLRAQN